jgi:hypothetical protein
MASISYVSSLPTSHPGLNWCTDNLQTYKVRDVAVSLLTCPFESYEEASKRASEYLRDFTNKLSRLDASETMNTLSLQSWVDTDRRKVRPG